MSTRIRGFPNYVWSRTRRGTDEHATFVSGDIVELLKGLKQKEGQTIWLVGGSALVGEAIKHDLLDELIVSRPPHRARRRRAAPPSRPAEDTVSAHHIRTIPLWPGAADLPQNWLIREHSPRAEGQKRFRYLFIQQTSLATLVAYKLHCLCGSDAERTTHLRDGKRPIPVQRLADIVTRW